MTKSEQNNTEGNLASSLSFVESALLSNPLIYDCVVLIKHTHSSQQLLVAYIVSSLPISPEQIQSQLENLIPKSLLASTYVPVSTIPLTVTGQVDEAALLKLEVIDSDLIDSIEKQLNSLSEIDCVAVVVEPQIKIIPPLHLEDLLPEIPAIVSENNQIQLQTITSSQKRETNQHIESKKPAISHGKPLQYPENAPKILGEVLQRAAEQSTHGIIYVQLDGSEKIQSYRELWEDAQRILAGLKKLGLKPQDKVIFQLENNQDFISAFWGCVLGGFVPVPISIAPSYNQINSTTSKLQNVWQMLGKPLVLTSASLCPQIHDFSKLFNLENFQVEIIDNLCKSEPDFNFHNSQPEDLAILLLTSGSTGTPKAVMQSHSSLIGGSAGTTLMNGFTKEDVSLNWFPLDHVGGIIMFHFRDVFLGCQQIHAPIELVLQEPTKWLDWISHYQATITWSPNFAYGLINEQLEKLSTQQTPQWDLSSMGFILNAGEIIDAKTTRRFLQLLKSYQLPATAMHPAWGMSETSSGVTYSDSFLLSSTTDEQKFVEVGAPIPGFAMRIVNTKNQVVEEETIGQLQVKGASVTSGYYQNPQANQEAFTEDGWFNTGDLGTLRSGRLTITGRQKDVIIINGLNHYCHEIEAAVEEVDGVEISYTAACPVRVDGSDTDKLAIFFNAKFADDQTLINLLKEIRTQVVNKIGINPDYLIPVDKEIIPKTAIGKIQRSQLSQRFHAGEFKPILKGIDILLGNNNTIPNWFYRQIWQAKSPLINKDYLNLINPTLIFLDSWGLGGYISRILSQYNLPYITVSSGENFLEINDSCYQISPKEAEHYQLLFNSLANKKIVVGQILHLWTYDEYTGDIESLEALEQAQAPGIYSLLFLVQALAKVQGFDNSSVKLLFISNHIQAILSTDLIAYEKSPVLGLIKTIPQELPWLNCRHIDLTFGEVEKNGDYILQELQISSKEREIAYRNGQRFVTRLEKVDLPKEPKYPIPLQQGGTYLLSGGLGGVGVEIAKYLLRNYQARLLLIGRTPLPEKSTWDLHLQEKDAISQPIKVYQELEQLGGEVIYEAVDICDLNNLQAIVEKAKNKWGKKLDGIIHLAGRFHEQFVLAETQENLAAVLRPKMLGSWTLHQLIKNQKDSFFINFSSINSFFGGSAVSAYAAANSFLDCFSHYQKYQSALQSYCFAWSMWDEIGMSEGYQMKNLTRAKGFYAMPSSQAISSMLAALHHNQTHLFIGLDGNNRNIRRWQMESDSLQKLTAYFTASSPVVIDADFQVKDNFGTVCTCNLVQLSEIPLTENGAIDRDKLVRRFIRQETGFLIAPRNETEEKIAQIWQQVLNIPSLGIDDNFFELGGNSLLATQVISRIRKAFGVETSLKNLFQAPTIAQLSQLIAVDNNQSSSVPCIIQPTERTQDLPLSFAQSRLWFIDQYEGANAIYNIFQGLRLEGNLNIEALKQAVNALIVRHETLRTGFLSSEGESVQIILPQLTLTIPVTDLGELSLEEQDLQVQHLVTQESHKPFDLKNPPLLRVSLFRLGATTHILLFTIHHIIADGWSMGVLNRELSHLYQAACQGISPSLPALAIQYADFAQWQRNWLQGDVLESQLSYWRKQLGGSLPVLELPTDHPRPAIQTYNGASISVELSPDLTNGLKALSQEEGVTLFMTLLAAFQILLYRYSGQEDIIVGTPIANRNRQEIEPLIGFFVNSLVLRINLGGNPSFRELLKQVREVTLGAYAHQDLPFEKLVEEIQPERDLSRNPLFQVWFNMINFTESTLLELMDLKAENLLSQENDSKFDLTLYLENKDKNIYLQLVYNKTLFNADTIEEMSKHFQQLLKVIVRNPEYPISNFSLLTETERYQLSCRRNLIQPSNPFTEFLKSEIKQSIPSRFQQQVEKYPHHFAIKTRNYEWTYEELNQQANNIAQQLLAYLPQEQIRIALLFEHDAHKVAAILAVLKLGQIYVPLDPDYPQDRVSYILEDSLASLILTNDHNFDKAQTLGRDKLPIFNIDQIESREFYKKINQEISADTIAYLLYTSGSTGKPKGVIQTHGNVLHFIRNYTNNLHISTQDKLTLFSSCTDAGVIDIFATLLNGATLYPFDIKQKGLANLSKWLREEEITIYHSTPTVYRYFLNSVTDKKDLEKIRLVVLGGETVVKQDVELYGEYFADDCIFVNGLGCTESSFNLQYLINKEIVIPGNSISVGYPFDDTEILLFDQAGNSTDIIGEIAIRSPHLALGYWRKPELTAEVFLPDPTGGKRRIYRTGDWGRFRLDGSLEFLGRKDFQVKIRGFRIELGEIEAVISQHPDVLNTVTIVREDIPGDKRLIAYIVLKSQERLTQTELRQLVKQKLPDYMIPSAFVFLEKIPLTPNGKIDRRALPAPDSSRQDTAKAFLAPRDELELQLAKIWEKVLGRKPIGVRDNFFDLGGHSLLGVKLFTQIEKSFPSNLPLSILFQAPTVEELAKVLRQEKVTPPWYSLVPIQPGGSRPILFGIHHIYFNDLSRYLGPEQPIYALHYGMAEATYRALSLPKMEDLAAHYIEEMRTLQPEGPYFLMGLSFGGVVAYEMAHQLVAQGQQVGLLALFDTHIKRGRKLLPLRQRVANLLRLTLPELMERVNGRVKAKLLVLRYGNQYLPHIYNREGMIATAKAYTPKPYPGRVNLFKAMDVSVSYVNYQIEPPELGWRKFITGELEIHEVPGSHIGILEEPNIQILAEKLRVCMDKALGDFEV